VRRLRSNGVTQRVLPIWLPPDQTSMHEPNAAVTKAFRTGGGGGGGGGVAVFDYKQLAEAAAAAVLPTEA
jgi:hypothetical protein